MATIRRLVLTRLAIAAAGIAGGLFGLILAQRADTASWAGGHIPAEVLLLAVGWAVIVAGLWSIGQAGGQATGILLTAAGFAWFVADWNNQYAGSGVAFTVGLALSTVGPVLVGHALLRYRGRQLDWVGRICLTTAYLGSGLLGGVGPALFFAPAQQGCASCPPNLLALQSSPSLVDGLGRAAVVLGPIWCLLLALAVGLGLARAGSSHRRLDAAALVPGIGYLLAVAAIYVASAGASYLVVGSTSRLLWVVSGILLVLAALGVGWPSVQRRLTRARVARLVVDVAGAPPVGGLGSLLSRSLRDPTLRVLYGLDDGTWVDAAGRPSMPDDGQTVTRVVRGAETVAVLAHRPGLLDDPNLSREISDSARLVLDNERLQAQTRAQLTDLQASRARIVHSGDAERRRLERDLHDGAQQQLVALALALQLSAMRRTGDVKGKTRLTKARKEIAAVLAELRALARGIYPRELADEGLAAALDTLAEASANPIGVEVAPSGRFPHAVEAAAYRVVAYLAKSSGSAGVRVAAVEGGGQLTVEVTTAEPPADLHVLEDRVGALGGHIVRDRAESGKTVIRALMPCGS
ncbi:MAG: histidine kinase [Actinomycetota bacterium]|nr:histidine kinase [Actinomycetota bacterium]